MKPHGLFLALSVALATPSSAQTLDECVALARRHAPAIRVADADVSRAEHGVREARAALAPTLRLGASYIQSNEAPKTVFPNPVTGSTTVVRVGSAGALDVRTDAQLTLYSGGRNGALVSAAEAVHLARVDLETAIGIPLDPAERLVEPGTPALDTPADSATAEQALKARPELAAYDEAIRENAHRTRAARAARSPLVNLNATA